MYVEFRTEGLEVVDYSVVLLLFEADERAVSCGSMTPLTASTRCTDSREAGASSRE